MENLETALLLMVVGMATVFAILLIVIYLGKLLISLVNKYAPEEQLPAKQGATFTNWSTRGTYLPADCHMSLKTRLNFTSLFISVFGIIL